MSWDPINGYTKERYVEFPETEEANATLSNITSQAPNRSEMITATAAPHPNNQTQQGSPALSSAPVVAGIPAGAIQWYRWQ